MTSYRSFPPVGPIIDLSSISYRQDLNTAKSQKSGVKRDDCIQYADPVLHMGVVKAPLCNEKVLDTVDRRHSSLGDLFAERREDGGRCPMVIGDEDEDQDRDAQRHEQ